MKNIVIKLGGSLLYDKEMRVNLHLVQLIKTWYRERSTFYDKIVVVVGGGKLSRTIGAQIDSLIDVVDDKFGIGMQATQLNAQIIKGAIDQKDQDILTPRNLGEVLGSLYDDNVKIIISGGLKKGWSTDMVAAVIADCMDMDRVYKLSKIDALYTADPFQDKSATKIKEITWKKYFKMFNIIPDVSKHQPDQNIPIDVTCAQFAQKKGISFFLSGGQILLKSNSDNIKLEDVFEPGSLIHT